MFNIKLEEKSYKMNFKAQAVKIQWSKTHSGQNVPPSPPGVDKVNKILNEFIEQINVQC